MHHKKSLSLLFWYSTLLLLLMMFIPRSSPSQQSIKKVRLKDGVEKWYRVKSYDNKPWLFKQIEEIFNVVISNDKKLPFGKSVAFLVGVSKYRYISPQLPYVENDLNDMRKFLLNQGGFDEVYVAKGDMVHRDLVEKYLKKTLRSQLSSEDRLLFFYAGHGDDDVEIPVICNLPGQRMAIFLETRC